MIPDRNQGIQRLVLLCECVFITLAFWPWFYLCWGLPIDQTVLIRYLNYNEFMLLGLVLASWRNSQSLGTRTPAFEEASHITLRQLGGTLFFLLLYLVAAQDDKISRRFFFTFVPLLYVILFAANAFLPVLLGRLTFHRRLEQKVLLIGPIRKALEVKRWLDQNHYLGLRTLGLLTEDTPEECEAAESSQTSTSSLHHFHQDWAAEEVGCSVPPHPSPLPKGEGELSTASRHVGGSRGFLQASPAVPSPWGKGQGEGKLGGDNPKSSIPSGGAPFSSPHSPLCTLHCSLPILGRPEILEKVLFEPGLTNVIMAEFPRDSGSAKHFVDLCESRGARLLVVADLDQIFGHPLAVFKDQGMFFIGLREEPLEDPVNRFFKRCLDIAVSLPVVIFILPPLMLVAWCFQRLQSPGPLLFLQVREGIQKRPFTIVKLRSMHVGNPSNTSPPKGTHDPRLYPFGRFSRKTSLDEIPQFWNVLRGDMSVVGPRPHHSADAEQFHRVNLRAYVRNFVKPGITGLAQLREVRGTPDDPVQVTRRINSDIEYLENWSLSLDCWLILRTVVHVFSPPKTAI